MGEDGLGGLARDGVNGTNGAAPPGGAEEGDHAFLALAERFLDWTRASASPDRIWAAAEEAFQSFGPCWLSYGCADRALTHIHFYRTTLPERFVTEFAARDMGLKDYVARHAVASRATFFWRVDPASELSASPDVHQMDRFLEEFGIRTIFSQPFHEGDLRYAISIFIQEDGRYGDRAPPEALSRFRFLASLLRAHYNFEEDALTALHPAIAKRYGLLTAREAEALRRVADGASIARAAAGMGLSEVQTRRHLSSAQRKLGAGTRDQAVAAATRLRALPPLPEDGRG